ncbi:VIT1/CCC1 transporter family protein [Gleimia hominis]|uniref:VIT1/CCC1 transporter family protein n=1 Tax=Gleimia hominis TaxID=595468 RepID=UPI001E570EC1|nr:VIT1/CCC1 transporter family protein [Gleimia hominis]WIK64303.1 VIT1/CCC1 transporter family protein [Gleimia hominis]
MPPQPNAPAPTREQIRRWRRYVADERMEAQTYRYLAKKRDGEEREILLQLAVAECRHEQYWVQRLGKYAKPDPKPSPGSWLLSKLARMFGTLFVLALAQRSEGRSNYDADDDASAQIAADEHIHGEVVRGLAERSRERLSGTFRAAVFGANDGLVSNLALIAGIAATGTTQSMVIAAGFAGLLAGALSMAAGEYISVTSQRELLEASSPSEDMREAVAKLDVHANELELVFRARGDSEQESRDHARTILAAINRPATELTTGSIVTNHAMLSAKQRAKLREDGQQFVEIGSGVRAGLSSFLFFATGAFLPLLPFMFGLSSYVALGVSVVIVGAALMCTGGVTGVLSGKSPLPRALRQLAIGYGATLVTYLLGLAFGASGV